MENKFEVIDFLRVILIIFVVTLHAYTTTGSVEWLNNGYPVYKFVTYNFALLAGYIAVPFFFFISGFLFFYSSRGKISYRKKWEKRIYTLLFPYMVWNFVTIVLFFFLQTIITEGYFSGDHKFVVDFSCIDFLRAFWDCGHWLGGDGTPILSVLWYVRNLIILSLLTPVMWYLNSKLRFFWLIPIFLIWSLTPRLAFTLCSVFWFGIGTYFGCAKIDIDLFFYKNRVFEIFCFIIFYVAYNVLFFYHLDFVFAVFVQRVCILFAIPVMYVCIFVGITKWRWKIPHQLVKAVFFIFVFHFFVVIGLRKLMVKLFPNVSDMGAVLLYFLSIVLTLFISFEIYILLRRLIPKILEFITGGRSQ